MSEIDLPVDYSELMEERCLEQILPKDCVWTEGLYRPGDGHQLRTAGRKSQLLQEVVRLADDALLIASGFSDEDEFEQSQIVNDSDWVHIQFRLRGGGVERVADAGEIATPHESCVVARYPQNAVIHRRVVAPGAFRVACLMLRPLTLARLLGISPTELPRHLHWLAQPERLALHSAVLPLTGPMRLAANDVLACNLRGLARGAFMRAKALELLALVVHGLHDRPRMKPAAKVSLSPLDVRKLNQAWRMITEQPESCMTLATLARTVGMNRTKLALGFKDLYGLPVQAFWRDAKLDLAREMLRSERARVTDVALSLGYAEVSSFTRAFNRKFGMLPRNVRGGGAED